MQLLVHPLGRSIEFQAGENLLEILVREAIPISYSCSAGRCGTCRCKVVSGSVTQALADARPEDGNVLACRTALLEDCTIEIPEPDEIVVHPARTLKATVVAIEAPTHDIRIVRLRTNRPWSFSPGQYATLQFSPEHVRPYSMAGLPADELMAFHIRLVPDGLVSGYVVSRLRIGDSVRVSGPLGTSYLRRTHDGPIICVAGGTGLAPVLSIVRGALEAGSGQPIHLYFGVRSEVDLYGSEVLAGLSNRYPNLHVHVVIATGPVLNGHRAGLVTDAIDDDHASLGNWRAYVCGAPAMVNAVKERLIARGLEGARIHADAFFPQAVAVQPA
jgi:ferredoxin-NAD(P)+ reductase (naphthalene dioxygenase ferredoxin-specific)